MTSFSAYDGTELAYRVVGAGLPVVCLPGGPMQDSQSLGDLGGLAAQVQLVLPDYRGTGDSGTPADTGTYRCDRLVDDVEALREQLGLAEVTLLAHCAGANLAVLYATRHPDRVAKLVLVTPSTQAIGINAPSEMRRELVARRAGEPWFAAASAAFEAVQAGDPTADWDAITPLTYGRWDAAAQAHHASGEQRHNVEAARAFGAEGAYDSTATRAALTTLDAPVLFLAGEVDVAAPPRVVAELAALFPDATVVVQPGGGHVPWLDDPARFSATIAAFVT